MQQTCAEASFEQYRKSTRRERFLDELAWATAHARSWRNSGRFRAPMSCCRRWMSGRSGCTASCDQITLRPPCSTSWVWACRTAYG